MRHALQKRLETLVAEFTKRILQAIRHAPLDELMPNARLAREAQRSAKPAAATRKLPTTRSDRAPKVKPPKPAPKAKASKPARTLPTRTVPAPKPRPAPVTVEPTPQQLEDALLRQLRTGALLVMDDVVSIVGTSEQYAPLVHAAVERLVASGDVGVAGQGAERLLFSKQGRTGRKPRARSKEPRRVKGQGSALTLVDSTPAPSPVTTALGSSISPSTDGAPSELGGAERAPLAEGAHPFVVRRKKAGSAE